MAFLLALMYLASASLTVLGATSLWRKAKRNTKRIHEAVVASNPRQASYDQVQTALTMTVEDLQTREEDTLADLWLVCGGVGFGAIASIVSLFI